MINYSKTKSDGIRVGRGGSYWEGWLLGGMVYCCYIVMGLPKPTSIPTLTTRIGSLL